jgi:hypothetical protein
VAVVTGQDNQDEGGTKNPADMSVAEHVARLQGREPPRIVKVEDATVEDFVRAEAEPGTIEIVKLEPPGAA